MQRQLRIQYPGSAAGRYNDATFALGGFTIASGNNTFTAGAQDALGRTDTNSITVNLPTTVTCTYDLNGNLTSDGTRGFDYDDENQLIRVTVTNSWKSEFVYDGKMRRRQRVEYTWSGSAWLTNTVGENWGHISTCDSAEKVPASFSESVAPERSKRR